MSGLVGIWMVAIVLGTGALLRRDSIAGAVAGPVSEDRALKFLIAADRPTLVLFLHPNCPCSRASLAELDLLARNYPSALRIVIVMNTPPSLGFERATSDLPSLAAAIPDARVIHDNGFLAHAMHAQTSGQVFVFGTEGQTLFSGGITASRGHVGDNDGVRAVEFIVQHPQSASPVVRHAPVYGCSLNGSSR